MKAVNVGICNTCQGRAPSEFLIRDGQVWIRKDCPQCGPNESLVSTDAVAWTTALPYQDMGITATNDAGDWIASFQTSAAPDWSSDWNFIPKTTDGGSASTYVCDYYMYAGAPGCMMVGGAFNSDAGKAGR